MSESPQMFDEASFSRLVVTGATGYIGTALTQAALEQGLSVAAATRRKPKFSVQWLPFDLNTPTATQLPDKTRAVIHLATATDVQRLNESQELEAAQHLVNEAQRVGARFIFVSSQTASATAISRYGRNKWALEQAVLAAGGCVVRPGLVYGGAPQGLYGRLLTLTRVLPCLPAFFPAPNVQPVHVQDLAAILLHAATQTEPPPQILCVGGPEPLSFTEFLKGLLRARGRGARLFVPIPAGLVRMMYFCLPSKIRQFLNLEQVVSLLTLPVMTIAPAVAQQLRPLAVGLKKPSQACRQLIAECRALLTYVLRQPPPGSLLRRTVRSFSCVYGPQPLGLPPWLCNHPSALSVFDTVFTRPLLPELTARICAATLLAEASPLGARRFLALDLPQGLFRVAVRVFVAGVIGSTILLFAAALRPLWKALLPRRGTSS